MTQDQPDLRLNRRVFTQAASASLVSALIGQACAHGSPFDALRGKHLDIGILLFPSMDQIDFTGPFAVLSRLPNATVHLIAMKPGPLRDHKGLILTPDKTLAEAPPLDILQVPGGPGQEALMEDEAVHSVLRAQMDAKRVIFSVCTGALICGAAGVLRGRKATTHWAAFDLLPYFGATPVDARVVVDGNLVSAAGVTAGIDGALTLSSLLRGDEVAQQIQLDIQYAPAPPFHAGDPKSAPQDVLATVSTQYRPLTDARLLTAKRIAARLGVHYP